MGSSFVPLQANLQQIPGMVGNFSDPAQAIAYGNNNPTGNVNDFQTMLNRTQLQQGNRAYQDAVNKYNTETQNYWLNGGPNNKYGLTLPTAPGAASSYYTPAVNATSQYGGLDASGKSVWNPTGVSAANPYGVGASSSPLTVAPFNPSSITGGAAPAAAAVNPALAARQAQLAAAHPAAIGVTGGRGGAAPTGAPAAPPSLPGALAPPAGSSGVQFGTPTGPMAPGAAPASAAPAAALNPLGNILAPMQFNSTSGNSASAAAAPSIRAVRDPFAPTQGIDGGRSAATPNSLTQPTTTPSASPASMPSVIPPGGVGGSVVPTAVSNVPGTTNPLPSTGPSNGTSAVDMSMAQGAGNLNYLTNIASGGGAGASINQLPAWQAMVQAQNQQNQQNYANMMAGFGAAGSRVGTDFGTSAQMYWNQAGMNQNSLLAQMQTQAMQQANQNQLSASGQLGGFAQQDLSQLSGQNFQSQMQTQTQQFQAAQAQYQAMVQAGLIAPQMNLQTSQALAQGWNTNLQTGSQLGQQQYTNSEDAINRAIQQFYQTQPQYNPTLGYQQTSSLANPQLFYPQYPQSQLGQILGGVGGLVGGSTSAIAAIYQLGKTAGWW